MDDRITLKTIPVLNPDEMRETETHAFDMGVSSLLLMEQAAQKVAAVLERMLGACADKRVLFLCGTGNNGGDGLAAARLFWLRGGKPEILLTGMPKTPDAHTNFCYAQALGLPFVTPEAAKETHYDGSVDALFGIGLRGAPGEQLAALFPLLQSPVLSVDIPSGMDGKTGDVPGACVKADETVTFHTAKSGLYLTQRRDLVGKITVADIGLRNDVPHECEMLAPNAPEWLENRPLQAHKGDCGRVLLYCGSMGMIGAAAMAAQAAVTAGAGLTTLLCPRDTMPVLQTLVPNAMALDVEAEHTPAYDVLALGCGLSQSEEIWHHIERLYDPDKRSVWDADALNLLAKHPMRLGENAVITPHAGEAARLLNLPVAEVLRDKVGAAKRLSHDYGCTAVLKSDVTVIASPEGRVLLCPFGSPALAKGGSGDVLCGIMAALLTDCREEIALLAALACMWHGRAGVIAGQQFGVRECTAREVIQCLHAARTSKEYSVPAFI